VTHYDGFMSSAAERDYVLGTHDAEVRRLAFQHDLWRPRVREAWLAAGIGAGSRVIDVGAGPGFATLDLAELVGPLGRVVAVERSRRFLDHLQVECHARGLAHVDAHEIDLMHDAIPARGLDAAWCRWVACFVGDPALLLTRLRETLRPGGTLVLHEYVDYATYRCLPPRPAIDQFVQEVMRSWREHGGEPDIARAMPTLLAAAGFRIQSTRPLGLSAMPHEPAWQWPAGFVRTNTPRLLEMGRVDRAWADRVLDELAAAEADPTSVFVSPLVLEIVAERA
jgi:SAM-dependent methyltransferase